MTPVDKNCKETHQLPFIKHLILVSYGMYQYVYTLCIYFHFFENSMQDTVKRGMVFGPERIGNGICSELLLTIYLTWGKSESQFPYLSNKNNKIPTFQLVCEGKIR